ncbi:unnamed protein product [Chilo suppressalis]|uniref:Ommochrome-binding protein-like n=1 Tax=Chilo suppressalis TaxID=168631 RepID=A0ABN8B3H8_CHISP|nr:unnamed protein product [Chilo suppressalis]
MRSVCLLLLYTTVAFAASVIPDRKCRGVYFDNKYYDIEILKEGINKIHQLVFNNNDNTVYFTFGQIGAVPYRSLGYYNLDTRQAGLIGGVRNASGVAVDQIKNKVYVGGIDGVYALNRDKEPERYPIYDNIHKLFFRDVLYYINVRKEAYVFDNGIVNRMPELQTEKVDDIIVDDDDNVFFLQNDTLFRVKLGTRAINIHEGYPINVMAVDPYYRAFFSTKNGIFIYNKYKFALDRVSRMKDLRALAFTKNMEPIYAVVDILIKLKANPTNCYDYRI